MTVAIIGTVGVPGQYGGFETLVDNLLDFSDQEVVVYCSSKSYENRQAVYKDARLHYIPFRANGIQSIVYDTFSILHAVIKGYRTLLVLGVSGALLFPLLKLMIPNLRLITNIDGIEWRRDKWGYFARKYLKLSESLAVRFSDVTISDNEAIYHYVKAEYNRDSCIIAYGGDHAVSSIIQSPGVVDGTGYALSICRIEPENNITMMLNGFAKLTTKLVVVGNWKNSEYGRSLISKYGCYSNLELLDPIYEIDTLFKLRSGCDVYVHGHSAGGTNPSLVEVMHFAKPILAFDCSYNRATTENRAGYFSSADDLAELVSSEAFLAGDIGDAMLEIARRRYTWEVVASQYWSLIKDQSSREGKE